MSERVMALIPAFNAATTIEPVVRDTLREVEQVVVVDDGSSDDCGEIARRAGATVLRHAANRGKGGALKTGFAYAVERGFDGVITLDADGQHLPSELPKFIDAHRQTGADLIIGGRAHLFGEMLPRRRLANRFSAWAIAKGSKTQIDDSQSGFRYYSVPMLREIPLRTEGFDLETEVIVRAGVRGYRVTTIPIALGFVDGVSTSHFRPVLDIVRILRTGLLARFFWR